MAKSIYVGLHTVNTDTPIIKKVEEVVVKNSSNAIKIVQGIYVKDDNGAIKQTYERLRTVTFAQDGTNEVLTGQDRVFAADQNNAFYNIKLNDYFSADDKRGKCMVIIKSGVYLLPSNTSNYGLDTGSSYGNHILDIVQNGKIYGAGGAGGAGGDGNGGTAAAGASGKAAIYIATDISMTLTGEISGGGGGGGGGAGDHDDDFWGDESAGGGGGGGGQCFGAGGAKSTYGTDGANGTAATAFEPGYGGKGGGDSDGSLFGGSGATAGTGGTGGIPGSAGTRGGAATSGDSPGYPGAGGAKGNKYKNQGSWKVNGTVATT